jgi:hypothetical protein
MERIHTLYITSTNKSGSDTNYNYNLYFSSYGINIAPDEDAYINITSFQTLNTFYNINDLSNTFKIKIITSFDVSFTYNFTIENGNYNIQEFQDIITEEFNEYASITYDTKKNKWNYIKTMLPEDAPYTFFIMPTIYNSKYFGLPENEWTELTMTNLLSKQINLNNFGLIVIKVIGLIELNKTLDNLNKTISSGDICALISRQDTAVNALVNWIDYNKTFIKNSTFVEFDDEILKIDLSEKEMQYLEDLVISEEL